jgi:hypothetical protein
MLSLLLVCTVAVTVAAQYQSNTRLSLKMLDSILSREQGVTVDASIKTSVIEAGLLLISIDEVLENMALSRSQRGKYEVYVERVMGGLVPSLMNVTADENSPLDEFSVGTRFIKQYVLCTCYGSGADSIEI